MGSVAAFSIVEAVRILVQRPHVVLYGDQALLELGARRAAHLDQLVGPYSRNAFHHPGPTVFYLLAPFVRLLEPAGPGLYLGAVVLNAAALVAVVAVVWRRIGAAAAVWTAAAIDLFCVFLGVGTLREPWNPYLVVAPMLLFVVLWAVGWTGSVTAAVWSVVIGSYEVQTHIATAPFVIVMCGILGVHLFRRRDNDRGTLWPGLVALALIWLVPVIELVRDRPDNAQLMWDFFTSSHAATPVGKAVDAATGAISVVPFGNHDYVIALHRGPWEIVIAAVLLVVGAVAALRRNAHPLSRALVGAATLAAVVGTVSLARADGPVFSYYAVWLSVVPLSILLALGPAAPAHARRALVGVCLVVAVLAVGSDLHTPPVSRTTGSGPWPLDQAASVQGKRETIRDTVALTDAVERVLRPGDHLVGFTIGTTAVWPFVAGVVLQLDQRGVQSTVGPADWDLYFGHERAPGRPVSVAFTLDLAGAPIDPRQTVVAEIDGTVLTARRAQG